MSVRGLSLHPYAGMDRQAVLIYHSRCHGRPEVKL